MSLYYPQSPQSLSYGLNHTQLDVRHGPLWPLRRGFAPTSQLIVNGIVHQGADRFHLDLVSTKGVAFHFNPRFPEGVVVKNSNTNANWDREERTGVHPLSPGNYFSITINCQESGYQVLLDGKVFTFFEHRHNPLLITHLRVGGDVKITGLFYFANNSSYPTQQPSVGPNTLDVSHGNTWNLNHGFRPGTRLMLRGTVHSHANRFHLDLVSKQGVAFHFNPRFSEGVVVRNSFTNGSWGVEERDGGLMLSPGQSFSVEFICDNGGIQVVVNGAMFTRYVHRHDPHTITQLRCDGDVKLLQGFSYPLQLGHTASPHIIY